MLEKFYVIRMRPSNQESITVLAAEAKLLGENLVLFSAQGETVASFLLENVESCEIEQANRA